MGKDSEKGEYRNPEGSYTWEYLSTFCCTLLMLCLGNVVGWNSPILGRLAEPDSPITLTPSDASSMAALVSFGHMVAPPLTMAVVDRLGRKSGLLMTAVPLMISWGMISVAEHVTVLLIARFIAGVAIGLAMCFCPVYLGEVASPQLRGRVGMLMTNMFNVGYLFAMVVVPYLTVPMSSCIFIGLVAAFAVSFSFMPESPYFLAMANRTEEAEAALEKLRGRTDVSDEIDLIAKTLRRNGEKEEKKVGAIVRLFTVRGNLKALFIALLFSCAQQMGGYSTIVVYGHVVFTAMGIGLDSHICTIIVAVIQTVTTLMASFLVDRLGRKPLVCVSGVASGLSVLVIGVYFYFLENTDLDVGGYATIPFAAVFLLVVAANFGLVPVQGVIVSEIFDADVKALASCTIGVVGGLIGTVCVKSYLMMATNWGLGNAIPFLTFGIVTWSCTATLMWLMPETKGKTFLEIHRDLNA